jgi:hypothetical protein
VPVDEASHALATSHTDRRSATPRQPRASAAGMVDDHPVPRSLVPRITCGDPAKGHTRGQETLQPLARSRGCRMAACVRRVHQIAPLQTDCYRAGVARSPGGEGRCVVRCCCSG